MWIFSLITCYKLPKIEHQIERSLEIEKGLGSAAATSALLSLCSYGLVGTLATASTGTAIGTLSGAAATNATLAWLGGGSLAAGGFGITGGMVALGGIALAPILAVGGFWAASKAEEAKTRAYEYAAEVDVAIANMNKVKIVLKGIRTAVSEQAAVIMETVKRFEATKVDNMDDETAFDTMCKLGTALKEMLNTPVLNADGSADENIAIKCKGYLEIGKKG